MDNNSKYNDRGLTGLANLGNTCFLNSCVQILSHTYELHDLLDGDYEEHLNNNNESLLLIEFNKLRELMWSKNCAISPGGFVKTVQKVAKVKDKELFTGYAQNDLPEFLLFIVDCMHESLKREVNMKIRGNVENNTDKLAKVCYEMMINMYTKEYSEIIKMMYGTHVSRIIDQSGKTLSAKPEPFFMLDVPLPGNNNVSTLEDCLDLYTESERLEGENAWFNEETNKKEELVLKNIVFWNLPNILVICLKRFSNHLRKNNKLITFPLTDLNMSKYVVGYNSNSYVYDLYGICNQSGGVQGGHYTAFVKNSNGSWYHFNDAIISKVDKLKI